MQKCGMHIVLKCKKCAKECGGVVCDANCAKVQNCAKEFGDGGVRC